MENREAVRNEVMRLLDRGFHDLARKLMRERCGTTDNQFYNQVAAWYLDKGDVAVFHDYEYYCRAYAYVPRGLSRGIRERMLRAFVKVGFLNHAERLAADIGRQLTLDEVLSLVIRYVHGSVQSANTEAELKRLAWEVGGELLESRVRRDIATMHVRWQREGLLY